MVKKKVLPIRAYMIHITHYDPRWIAKKKREKPVDVDLALEMVDAMAEAGLNTLVVDAADGVKYRSHPELARHYTISMRSLKRIAARAHRNGLDVVPKLNFAQSALHGHNDWFKEYYNYFDDDTYWKNAFEVVDELVEACAPGKFFHIGMDEDHDRSHEQFNSAIVTLRNGLRKRKLRAVMWKDIQTWHCGQHHREKSEKSEARVPRDVVQVPWDYSRVRPEVIRRLRGRSFDVWGAPGWQPDQVAAWRDALLRYGCSGILLTRWIPCRPANRKEFLRVIRECGPVCSEC